MIQEKISKADLLHHKEFTKVFIAYTPVKSNVSSTYSSEWSLFWVFFDFFSSPGMLSCLSSSFILHCQVLYSACWIRILWYKKKCLWTAFPEASDRISFVLDLIMLVSCPSHWRAFQRFWLHPLGALCGTKASHTCWSENALHSLWPSVLLIHFGGVFCFCILFFWCHASTRGKGYSETNYVQGSIKFCEFMLPFSQGKKLKGNMVRG